MTLRRCRRVRFCTEVGADDCSVRLLLQQTRPPLLTHRTSWGAAGTGGTCRSRSALFRSRRLDGPDGLRTGVTPGLWANLPRTHVPGVCWDGVWPETAPGGERNLLLRVWHPDRPRPEERGSGSEAGGGGGRRVGLQKVPQGTEGLVCVCVCPCA